MTLHPTISRNVTVVILGHAANKPPSAQQVVMVNIHERFHSFISNTLGAMSYKICWMQSLTDKAALITYHKQ